MTNSLIAQNLVSSLLVRGIGLEISTNDPNKIKVTPADQLTANDRYWIKELKFELLEIIRAGLNTVKTVAEFRRLTGLNLRLENGQILVSPPNQVTQVIGNWISANRDYVAAVLNEDRDIATWLERQGFDPEGVAAVLTDDALRAFHYWQMVGIAA